MVFDVQESKLVTAEEKFLKNARSAEIDVPEAPLPRHLDVANVVRKCAILPLMLVVFGVSLPLQGEELVVNKPKGTLHVVTLLRAKGELKPTSGTALVEKLPVEIDGRLEYVERPLSLGSNQHCLYRSIRHYRNAEAKIKLPDGVQATSLSDARRVIGLEVQPQRLNLYSPHGPLTRDDLELISAQADPAAVAALVSGKTLNVKGAWQPDDAAVARMTGLDDVTTNDVNCTVEAVQNSLARIRVAGNVEGKCEGAKAKIQLSGVIDWSLAANHATNIALSIEEQRETGQGTPGFSLKADIRTTAKIVTTPKEIARETLGDAELASTDANRLLDFLAETSGFRLTHDRRWRVVVHRTDSVVMRLINDGVLVGQVNVVTMPQANGTAAMEIDKFQQAVLSGLEKHAAAIEEASKAETDAGVEILRVAAKGKVEEVPVRWIYYHLNDKHGHRAALVFTIEEAHANDFSDADHRLVGNFEFVDRQTATANAGPQAPANPARTSARPVAGSPR